MQKRDMQVAPSEQPHCDLRSLSSLEADYKAFEADGAQLPHVKLHNVIRQALIPIPLEWVCILTLHLDLGIYVWLFEAFVADTRQLDVCLAKALGSSGANPSDSTSFAEATALSTEIDNKTQQKELINSQVSLVQSQVSGIFDPFLQVQRYFGGAFIGNHIHQALKRSTTHDITHCHVELVAERCPRLLLDALLVADRYDKLMTLYADCREIFSSSKAIDSSTLKELDSRINMFMTVARHEVVQRSRGNVTPKLHLLEAHVASAIRHFGVGLGQLGEQGGESIHAEFNQLSTTFNNVVRELDRLKMVVQQHCLSTLPQQLAKAPAIKRRRT